VLQQLLQHFTCWACPPLHSGEKFKDTEDIPNWCVLSFLCGALSKHEPPLHVPRATAPFIQNKYTKENNPSLFRILDDDPGHNKNLQK